MANRDALLFGVGLALLAPVSALMLDSVDSRKRQAVLVRFYELRPKEIRHLMVFGMGPATNTIQFKLLELKTKPDRAQTQPGKVALMFSAPEPGVAKGARFKIEVIKS